MLHFFRRIRQRLLTENRFTKYLLYAVGEILLVVIGILIALQVNNWNEERTDSENNKNLFLSVSDELVQNIEEIDKIIEIYTSEDPLYFKVLRKKVDYEDYKNGFSLLPRRWQRTNLTDGDFKELLAEKNNLTELQDSILSELRDLYGRRKLNSDKDEKEIAEYHFNRNLKWRDEHNWLTDLDDGLLSDEIIQFALTDPSYLNEVFMLQGRNRGHLHGMLWFRTQALDLYKEIMDMLQLEKDSSLVQNIEGFEHIKGVYELKLSADLLRFEIYGKEELKFNRYINDSLTNVGWDVHFYSKSHLITYGGAKPENYMARIKTDKNGNVLGLIWIGYLYEDENGNRKISKKIE